MKFYIFMYSVRQNMEHISEYLKKSSHKAAGLPSYKTELNTAIRALHYCASGLDI